MVDLEVSAGVALIRMGSGKVNAFSPGFCRALIDAVARAEADSLVGAIVLASSVPGVFSAGLDLKELSVLSHQELESFAAAFFGLVGRICSGPLPVVAALEGHAIAGGALMLCAADRRVASEGGYKVGLTEVALGLLLPDAMREMVRRVLGQRAATEVLCFGEVFDLQRGLDLGFADRLVPEGRGLEEALGEARRLAALPRAALREYRRGLKGDLGDRLAAMERHGYSEFVDYWFAPECSAARAGILQRLGGK
jgi:enoyl-CoA hydratase/carnithine racemase